MRTITATELNAVFGGSSAFAPPNVTGTKPDPDLSPQCPGGSDDGGLGEM
jgi:hypothetical protein